MLYFRTFYAILMNSVSSFPAPSLLPTYRLCNCRIKTNSDESSDRNFLISPFLGIPLGPMCTLGPPKWLEEVRVYLAVS